MINLFSFRRIFLILFSFVFFSSIFVSSFCFEPKFEFTTTSYPGGSVDISGFVSSASSIDFYINDNYISREDVYGPERRVYLSGTIEDVLNVPIGSNVVFINNDSSRVYKLNISGDDGGYKELNYGDEFDFKSFNEGSFVLKDEEEGVTKTISVVNSLVNFTFKNMQDYLNDGDNTLKFVISPIRVGDFTSFTETRNVDYTKYSVVITASVGDNLNITNKREINVSGFISDSRYPIYYVLNSDDIGNIGSMQSIEKNGNNFNFTVGNLNEGNNTIRIISVDDINSNIFNGEKRIKIIVDTIPPKIDIVSTKFKTSLNTNDSGLDLSEPLYVNKNSIVINISTDASILNYTFNGDNFSLPVVNNTVIVNLNLVKGKNNLTFYAFDLAGNEARESHELYFSNTKPDFAKNKDGSLDLEPKELVKSPNVVHFPFIPLSGKMNEGDVTVTVFSIPRGAKDSEGNQVTCESYEPLFLRDLGQLKNSRSYDSQYNPDDIQMSLTSLMFNKQTFTTDSEGNFGGGNIFDGNQIVLGLQEDDIKTSEVIHSENAQKNNVNPKVEGVSSSNQVCFFMKDKYGNVNKKSFSITLDAGNTMWKPEEITTIPNTVYSGEIEETGDVRSGNGGVRFMLIAHFKYIGMGRVSHLTNFRIRAGRGDDSNNMKVIGTEMHYKLDKNTGELIIAVPVEMKKLGKSPMDYPDSMTFWFEGRPTYSVDLNDVPIDNTNPIYFKTSINIERPLDHTKWLTPKTINSIQSFLNKTIKFTKQGINYMGTASVIGVLACTGAKFIYGAKMGLTKDEQMKNDYKKTLFTFCDRVMCSASPKKCVGFDKQGFTSLDKGQIKDFGPDTEFKDDKQETLTKITSFKSNGQPCVINGQPGVYARVNMEVLDKEVGYLKGAWTYKSSSKKYMPNQCVEAKYSNIDVTSKEWKNANYEERIKLLKDQKKAGEVSGVKLSSLPSVCFVPDAPKFDGTRCNFFGMEDPGAAGWDPSDNIIESIRCGCLTDTYSHLKNYLKVQEGIYMCLEQAKVGDVKGSYCERLMGKAVCDVATNVIFRTIAQKTTINRVGTNGKDPHTNPIMASLQGVKDGDKLLNERYGDSFYSQAGLSTDKIVNKVCLGAITGDWSVLTDSILSSIDNNEVKPIFGPMFPESRIQGYDPLTGELSISYRLSYAVVSGGQAINTKLTFICNKAAPGGNFCPDDYLDTDMPNAETKIRTKRLYVPKGGTKQDTIVVTDNGARWRFNQVKMTHTYKIKDETKTKEIIENIIPNGELFENCYFTAGVLGSGAGFHCDALFSDNALISGYELDKTRTKILPGDVFYEGNAVFANIAYSVRSAKDQETGFDISYKAECRGINNGKTIQIGSTTVDNVQGNGMKTVKLFEIPPIGTNVQTKSLIYSLDVSKISSAALGYSLKFVSLDNNKEVQFNIKNSEGFETNNDLSGLKVVNGEMQIDGLELKSNAKEISLEIESSNSINIFLVEHITRDNDREIPFGVGKEKEIQDYTSFHKLQTGECSIYLRILPKEKGSEISTPTQFDNYNPLGDDSNIDTNIKQTDTIVKKINIVKTPSESKDYVSSFSFVNIRENSILKIKDNKTMISYIYEIPKGNDLNEKLHWYIDFDRISGKIEGEETYLFNSNDLSETVSKKVDNDILKSIGNKYVDATFHYEVLKKRELNDKVKWERVSGKYGSFRIKVGVEGNGDVSSESGDKSKNVDGESTDLNSINLNNQGGP